mgnify:CR=1 FL=1
MSIQRYRVLTPLALLVAVGCADKAYDRAVQVGQVSKSVYDAVSDPAAAELGRLAGIHRDTGDLSEAQWKTYKLLRQIQPTLEKYGETHQAYVAALKVWRDARKTDLRAPAPADLVRLLVDLERFIKEAREVKKALE